MSSPHDLLLPAVATLNPDARYAKTDKGREEVTRRSHGLPLALRSVLILIDGKAPMRELLKHYESIPTFGQDLSTLIDDGFIADVGAQGTSTGDGHERDSAPASSFGTDKDRLIELARQLLGEHAATVIARLGKSADSHDDLAVGVESCYKLIKLTIDEKKAEQFRDAARRVLSGLHDRIGSH